MLKATFSQQAYNVLCSININIVPHKIHTHSGDDWKLTRHHPQAERNTECREGHIRCQARVDNGHQSHDSWSKTASLITDDDLHNLIKLEKKELRILATTTKRKLLSYYVVFLVVLSLPGTLHVPSDLWNNVICKQSVTEHYKMHHIKVTQL